MLRSWAVMRMTARDQYRGHHACGGMAMNPMPEPCKVVVRAAANFIASVALNGLNARSHRLKTVDALTEVQRALPWD